MDKNILKTIDTESDEFKKLIKYMNVFSQTQHEQHLNNKELFRELMPFLRGLDEEEMRILAHKVRNSRTNTDDWNDQYLWNTMADKTFEKKLAKISEDENYNDKNRYRL